MSSVRVVTWLNPTSSKIYSSGTTLLSTQFSTSVSGGYTFFGFDWLSSPITSLAVQISNALGNPQPVLDNFTVVPEPATWAMMLIGLRVMGAVALRRRQSAA